MTRAAQALLLLIAACSSGPRLPRAPRGEQVIVVRGAIEGGPYRLGQADLDALPRRAVRGADPATGRAARWEGVNLYALVREGVEPARGADTVVVRTVDRMAIPVPLTVIRQLQPVLANRADGAPLPQRILAWPNAEQRGLKSDPRAALWWARGVVALEVVNSHRSYGRALYVPEAAPEGARAGAGIFEARCVACHRVRRVGGTKGPDLTRKADTLALEAFRALLDEHPGWNQQGLEPPAAEAAEQTLAFLRSVSAYAKVVPDYETGVGDAGSRDVEENEEPGGGPIGR
jgi:hypothetical protein